LAAKYKECLLIMTKPCQCESDKLMLDYNIASNCRKQTG